MNWDAIGAVAELAAAVGVIFSLVYLARQIRQSNATDQLTATLSLQSSYNEVGDLFLRDGDVVSRGLLDLDSLDAADQLKFLVIFHLFFGHVELVHSHARKGMLDRDLLNRTYTSLYAYYRLPGVKQWWSRMGRGQFSPEFVAFVEDPGESGLREVPAVPAE
jgi:hypothetical protein